jgi:hypothetical protein
MMKADRLIAARPGRIPFETRRDAPGTKTQKLNPPEGGLAPASADTAVR